MDRRRGHLHGRVAGAARPVSRARRTGGALRIPADPQLRHPVRQSRERLADRRFDPGLDRAGSADRTAPRRAAAPRAARGFLPRLPQDGSGGGRVRHRGGDSAGRRGAVAGELQGLETHRPGHLRGQRDLLRERRGRPRAERPSRLWRLGRHRLPRTSCRACPRRLRLDSAGDRGRRRRARERFQTLVGSACHGRLSPARRRQSVAPLFSATPADGRTHAYGRCFAGRG